MSVWVCVYVCVCVCVHISFQFSWVNSRNLIAGLYSKTMFSFLRIRPHCLAKWVCRFAFPPAMNASSCCSTFSLGISILSCLASYSCFNVH